MIKQNAHEFPKANLSSQIGDKQLYDKLKNGKSDYTRFGLRFLRDLPTVRLFGQKGEKPLDEMAIGWPSKV